MPSFFSAEKRKEGERSLKGKGELWTWKPGLKEKEKVKKRKYNTILPTCPFLSSSFIGMSTNTGSEQRHFKSSEGSQHPSKKYANRSIWNQSNFRTPLYIGVTFPVCFHYLVSALNRTRKDHLGTEQRTTTGYFYTEGEKGELRL